MGALAGDMAAEQSSTERAPPCRASDMKALCTSLMASEMAAA
jgi:hypothetical protein